MAFNLEDARRRLAAHDGIIGRERVRPEIVPKSRDVDCPTRDALGRHEAAEPDEWERFMDRLIWHYGPEHPCDILDGRDPATEADIAKWKGLGQPKRGAA